MLAAVELNDRVAKRSAGSSFILKLGIPSTQPNHTPPPTLTPTCQLLQSKQPMARLTLKTM